MFLTLTWKERNMREKKSAKETREKIYKYIKKRGKKGATDEEGFVYLGIGGCTYRQARSALVKEGLVEASGEVRHGTSAFPATVWKITDKVFE